MKKVYGKYFTNSYAWGEGAPSWIEIYDSEIDEILFILYEGEQFTIEEFRKMALEDSIEDLVGLYTEDELEELRDELTSEYNNRDNYELLDGEENFWMENIELKELGFELEYKEKFNDGK